MYTKQQREQYNQYRDSVCEKLGLTINQYNYIRRLGNKINFLDTQNCNGDLDNNEYYQSLLEDLFHKLFDYRKKNKLNVYDYHQSDPRGVSIYLSKVLLMDSNYNTNGYSIY